MFKGTQFNVVCLSLIRPLLRVWRKLISYDEKPSVGYFQGVFWANQFIKMFSLSTSSLTMLLETAYDSRWHSSRQNVQKRITNRHSNAPSWVSQSECLSEHHEMFSFCWSWKYMRKANRRHTCNSADKKINKNKETETNVTDEEMWKLLIEFPQEAVFQLSRFCLERRRTGDLSLWLSLPFKRTVYSLHHMHTPTQSRDYSILNHPHLFTSNTSRLLYLCYCTPERPAQKTTQSPTDRREKQQCFFFLFLFSLS